MKIFIESRNLVYGPPDQMNLGLIASLNNNILVQPNEPNSIARTLNFLKSKLLGMEYEFFLGKLEDWETEGKKAVCWIKLESLIKELKNPERKNVDLFCFIDSDAWVRDDALFLDFCQKFLESSYPIGIPRDIELPGNSFLNSGFMIVKNKQESLDILETIYNHPDYRNHELRSWHEQSELSVYHEKNPGKIMVLPLNDFNTPCGRIVRHCWIKHLIDPLVIEEVVAVMTRLAIRISPESKCSLGPNVLIYPSS